MTGGSETEWTGRHRVFLGESGRVPESREKLGPGPSRENRPQGPWPQSSRGDRRQESRFPGPPLHFTQSHCCPNPRTPGFSTWWAGAGKGVHPGEWGPGGCTKPVSFCRTMGCQQARPAAQPAPKRQPGLQPSASPALPISDGSLGAVSPVGLHVLVCAMGCSGVRWGLLLGL